MAGPVPSAHGTGDPGRVGPYRVEAMLGRGGMGAVYLGRAPDGRPVAVKVVRPDLADDPRFLARFRAEAANAARVASFCTAQVLDHGTDDGVAYLVTEYVEGPTLRERVADGGPLSPAALHGVAVGIAAALVAIHGAGLVHRDLKPGNVLLSISGPRVIDFGIARALDETERHTATGQFVGTPGWTAPEQITARAITPAADVFAWGCLVAYAATGNNPFGRGSFEVVSARVLHAEPELGGLPEPLGGLVRAALGKDPAHRPTARDLLLALVGDDSEAAAAAALDAGAAAPPVSVPPTRAARPRRGTRRRAWTIAVPAAAAALVLAGGAVLYGREPGRAAPARPPDDPLLAVINPYQGCAEQIAVHTPGAAETEPVYSSSGCTLNPRWSPDRSLIAFVRREADDSRMKAAWVMNADGTDSRKVADMTGVAVAWTPDGTGLTHLGEHDGREGVLTVDVRTGEITPEATEPAGSIVSFGGPAWSPTGRLAFSFSRREAGPSRIYVVDPDRPQVRTPVTPAEYAGSPAWSPDGSQIAYTVPGPGFGGDAGVGLEQVSDSDIRVVGADGTNPRRLEIDGDTSGPVWSPDGTWIAYTRRGLNREVDLRAVKPDGTGDRSLIGEGSPYWLGMPDW